MAGNVSSQFIDTGATYIRLFRPIISVLVRSSKDISFNYNHPFVHDLSRFGAVLARYAKKIQILPFFGPFGLILGFLVRTKLPLIHINGSNI